MTRIDEVPLPPQRLLQQPRGARTRSFAIVAVLTCGLTLGAGSLALGVSNLAAAAQEASHSGWRAGLRLAFIQRAAALLLDSVGATAAQESKAHDIIAATFTDLASDPKEAEALRKQALDLLGRADHRPRRRRETARRGGREVRREIQEDRERRARYSGRAHAGAAGAAGRANRGNGAARPDGRPHGPLAGRPLGHPMDDRPPDNSTDKD